MHSDTVVGIVGAAVLVAVMVGVFAYEYNNAPVLDDSDSEAAKIMSFNETFSGLDAMGDLDGDGIPNWNETDLDNDGILNVDDDAFDFKVHHDAGGAISGLPAVSGYTHSFTAESGLGHVLLEVSHGSPLAQLPALSVTLTAPDGSTYSATATTGTTYTYEVEMTTDMGPGMYTVSVQPPAVPVVGAEVYLATTVTGELTFHYY